MQPFGHNINGPKIGQRAPQLRPLLGRGLGPYLTQGRLAEAYLHAKCHLDPSSHWPTTDMGRKLAGSAPLGEGELGPHLTQCGHGWGLPTCQVSSWSIQPFGHNRPTLHTGQTDNGPIAYGKRFYKRSPKKLSWLLFMAHGVVIQCVLSSRMCTCGKCESDGFEYKIWIWGFWIFSSFITSLNWRCLFWLADYLHLCVVLLQSGESGADR